MWSTRFVRSDNMISYKWIIIKKCRCTENRYFSMPFVAKKEKQKKRQCVVQLEKIIIVCKYEFIKKCAIKSEWQNNWRQQNFT